MTTRLHASSAGAPQVLRRSSALAPQVLRRGREGKGRDRNGRDVVPSIGTYRGSHDDKRMVVADAPTVDVWF